MKKILFLLFLCALPALAQNHSVVASLAVADSASCANNATTSGSTLLLSPLAGNDASVVIQLSGTFSATAQFQGTGDGANWVSVNGFPLNSTSGVSSATAAGAWRVTASGLQAVRVCLSVYASGAVQTSITSSAGPSANGFGGGGGGGTVTQVNTTAPISGGPITSTGTIACATCTTAAAALTSGNILEGAGSQALAKDANLDDGVTTANTLTYSGTGGITASAGPIVSASDGTHAGRASVVGNTTAPTLPTNSFSFLGPNSAAFTSFAWQPPTAENASAGILHIGAASSHISQATISAVVGSDMANNTVTATQLAAQYSKRACAFGLGDGTNAIAAATYPSSSQMLQCVNNSGVTWTVTGIHCLTDNAGTSTINVYNNTGTSLLTGAITCNATKTSGGAAGTLGSTTTIATTDGLNFVFVADGTSKYVTATVDFTY